MTKEWQSQRLHEHPAPHNKGVWGRVCVTDIGIYYLNVGGSHMSCPQDWAAKIHAAEQEQSETAYILKGIPADLWHKAKVRAAEKQVTLKDVLLQALQKFISE